MGFTATAVKLVLFLSYDCWLFEMRSLGILDHVDHFSAWDCFMGRKKRGTQSQPHLSDLFDSACSCDQMNVGSNCRTARGVSEVPLSKIVCPHTAAFLTGEQVKYRDALFTVF